MIPFMVWPCSSLVAAATQVKFNLNFQEIPQIFLRIEILSHNALIVSMYYFDLVFITSMLKFP